MTCFVFPEPVTALILTVKPLQSWPSVDVGRTIVISPTFLTLLRISLAGFCLKQYTISAKKNKKKTTEADVVSSLQVEKQLAEQLTAHSQVRQEEGLAFGKSYTLLHMTGYMQHSRSYSFIFGCSG